MSTDIQGWRHVNRRSNQRLVAEFSNGRKTLDSFLSALANMVVDFSYRLDVLILLVIPLTL